MDSLLIFMAIAGSLTLATDQLKQTFKLFTNFKVGLLIAQALGVWAIFSLQLGLISSLGIEYNNMYFQYFDLFTTAFIVSAGAGLINKWVEIVQGKK